MFLICVNMNWFCFLFFFIIKKKLVKKKNQYEQPVLYQCNRAMENETRSPFSNRHPDPAGAAVATTSVLPTTVPTGEASLSTRRLGRVEWPTIDGSLGLSHDEALTYAGRFFKLGFLCLPFLWAINCFYFWPVLRHSNFQQSHPRLRRCKSPFLCNNFFFGKC